MRLAQVILRFVAIVPMLGLSACTTTPYVTPSVPTTATFVHAGSGTDTVGTFGDAWWKAFGDPNLNVLVSAVLARNNNLAAAAVEVRLAQNKAGLARLDQWPSLSGALGATTTPSTRYSANMAVAY
jgi:outer membrane protein TolC